MLVGCGQTNNPETPVTPWVDVKPAQKDLYLGIDFGKSAGALVGESIVELNNPSPRLEILKSKLTATKKLLDKQEKTLSSAKEKLLVAEEMSALSHKQMLALHKESAKWKEEAEKYKSKYLKLTKYRWAFFSAVAVGGLLVVAKIKGIFL